MPTPVASLPLSAPVSSWASTSLKYLLSSLQAGSCPDSDLVPAPTISPDAFAALADDSVGAAQQPTFTPIVTRPDVSRLESPATLRTTEKVAPSWRIDEDAPRAPVGSLLLVLGSKPGAVAACKIAATELAVASSVAVLIARPEVNARWLRYALLASDIAEDARPIGLGVGLAALLQRKILVPPRSDQDLIADQIDRSTAALHIEEAIFHRQADLLAARREALMRGLIQGDPALISLASDPNHIVGAASSAGAPTASPTVPAVLSSVPSPSVAPATAVAHRSPYR